MFKHGQVRYGPAGWEVWDDPMEFWLSEELLAERAPRLLKALRDAKEIGPKLHEWRLDAQEQRVKDIPVQDRPEKPGREFRVYTNEILGPDGSELSAEQLRALSNFAHALANAADAGRCLQQSLDDPLFVAPGGPSLAESCSNEIAKVGKKHVNQIGPRGPKWV